MAADPTPREAALSMASVAYGIFFLLAFLFVGMARAGEWLTD